MFEYSDPTGRDFLSNAAATQFYQNELNDVHRKGAELPNSAFTLPEAFSDIDAADLEPGGTVEWPAYPVSTGQSDTLIDADRFMYQDEYIEWHVDRSLAGDLTITFTTEFPEYFESFAAVGFDALKEAIQDVYPGSDPTPAELFGAGFLHETATAADRATRFRAARQANPWNNGQKGILCLSQGFNTLGALINLFAHCSIPRPDFDVPQVCALVGGFCGELRNSDPRISNAVQIAALGNLVIGAKDPVGIEIGRLSGTWQLDDTEIDISTAKSPSTGEQFWTISRNGRRAVFQVPANDKLTLANAEIVSGAQLSRVLMVVASVTAAKSELVPDWARTGNEMLLPANPAFGV